jgi:pimeloyl-ACP methyl ester carboxylesterase
VTSTSPLPAGRAGPADPAGLAATPTDAPGWVAAALRVVPERRTVVVAGARIASLVWGEPGRPTLVLVHGGAAHAAWWRVVAPSFLPAYRVVAVDLSGHGDSDHRERYAFPGWVDEVLAVAEVASAGAPCVLVGHSMGGVVTAMAAAATDALAGSLVADTPLRGPELEEVGAAEAAFSVAKRYRTEGEARARFRILPEQPVEHPALVAQVAADSVRHDGEAWTWKFDRRVFATPAAGRPPDLGVTLAAARVPVGAVVGERSAIVGDEDRTRLRWLTEARPALGYHEVAAGHHHLMFDRPRALAAAIATALTRLDLPPVPCAGPQDADR